MRFLPATAADAGALAAVHAQAFDSPWTEQAIADLFAGSGVLGFLVEDSEPLGMILFRLTLDEAEVLTLGVSPSARRRGIGAALVEAAVQAARAGGAREMLLEVAEDNLSALALYRRMGFSQAAVRRWYYDRGASGKIHALLMRRDLNAGPRPV